MNATIGKNLKSLRKYNRLSQDLIATFLGIKRSAYSNYETGEREAPLDILERCADIYGCDLRLFFEEDETVAQKMLLCAFRLDELPTNDLVEMARFKSIVKNYIKMNLMENPSIRKNVLIG